MKPMTSGERRPAYRATPTVPQAVAVAVLKRGSGQLERTTADTSGQAHHENLTKFSGAAKLSARAVRISLNAENRHHERSEVRRFRVVRHDGVLLCGATSLELAARFLANVTRDGQLKGHAFLVTRAVKS